MPPRSSTKRPRVYLLWGQEELRKREALEALLDGLVAPEDRALDVEYLDATNAGVTGETILHAARDRAMFSEKRVVVLLNAGRLRGPRHQRTQEVLAAGIPALPEYSTLILVANAEDSEERRSRAPFGEKLMAAIKAAGEARQFAPLKPEELAQLAVREATALEKKLPPAAATMLANRVGPDSHRLIQETRKLAAYIGDRSAITPQDVAAMVPAPPDDNVFHLLDATMDGDQKQALSVLRELRMSGLAVPQMLVLLGRTLRQVAQAKYLHERGVSPSAEASGVPAEVLSVLPEEGQLYRSTKEWQRKRLWSQARRISWEHLHHALDRMAVTDAGTKGWEHGVEDPDLALELFVVSLCDTVRANPSRPSHPEEGLPRSRRRG
jgi:DNA polymerase III subunit delta